MILNWNGRNYLEQFLPSVLATTYARTEVVVIDNASTDDSLAFLQHYYPQIRIISNSENAGFAGGYNQGLQEVKADYYVLLNSDVEVEPGWVEPVISLMERNRAIGACQPKLLQYADKSLFEYAGAAGGWIDALGYPFARGRVFDHCETDKGQYNTAVPVAWASGAAFFIRASLYQDLGGFDASFFAHMEEIDLCWRMQNGGHEVWYCPDSVVYHVGGGTLPKGSFRKVFLNYRNNAIMLAKNLPLLRFCWVFPLRLALDAVAAWKALFGGDPAYFRAVVKAHWEVFKWLFGKKTGYLFPEKRGLPKAGLFRGSLVYRYFLRGQKSFREIVH